MKKELVIFHLSAIELFPPVLNFINYISEFGSDDFNVKVITTKAPFGVSRFFLPGKNVKILRLGRINGDVSSVFRSWSLLVYNLFGIFNLLFSKPALVLYYETNSSLPVLVNLRLFRQKFDLYIHYHEYMSLADYARSRFQKRLHLWERSVYSQAAWISHTNEARMQLFLQDIGVQLPGITHILHNYPSRNWQNQNMPEKSVWPPLKFVYVGSYSFSKTYMREFINWMYTQEMDLRLDVYTQSPTDELEDLLSRHVVKKVYVKGFVDYKLLPGILPQYHVGLILYKGDEQNVSLSAPNKLFEYQACGLDVWVDNAILGAKAYHTEKVYPKVVGMNYADMVNFKIKDAVDKTGCTYEAPNRFYENEYAGLLADMKKK